MTSNSLLTINPDGSLNIIIPGKWDEPKVSIGAASKSKKNVNLDLDYIDHSKPIDQNNFMDFTMEAPKKVFDKPSVPHREVPDWVPIVNPVLLSQGPVKFPNPRAGLLEIPKTSLEAPRVRVNDLKISRMPAEGAIPLGAPGNVSVEFPNAPPELAATTVKQHYANNVNSQDALNRKMRALQKAQNKYVKIKELPDGRVRYYMAEVASKMPGPTRGSAHVVEFNSKTGQVREWRECYDYQGNVNRVHPKMVNGQEVISQHYPPIKIELDSWNSKPKRKK